MSRTTDYIIGMMESGELTEADYGATGNSDFDYASSQENWNSVLGASMLLVYEVVAQQNGLSTVMLSEAHNHAITIAIDSIVNKQVPTLDYAYLVMGFNDDPPPMTDQLREFVEQSGYDPIPF